MKKAIVALFAGVALLFAVNSCKSETPVDKLISMMTEIVEYGLNIQDNPEYAQDANAMGDMMKKLGELQEFAKENKDYVLTDADRDALRSFMKEMGKKIGEEPDEDDLEEVDDFETLGDILDEMDMF